MRRNRRRTRFKIQVIFRRRLLASVWKSCTSPTLCQAKYGGCRILREQPGVPGSSCKHAAALRRGGGGERDLTLAVSLERSLQQLSTSPTNTSQRGRKLSSHGRQGFSFYPQVLNSEHAFNTCWCEAIWSERRSQVPLLVPNIPPYIFKKKQKKQLSSPPLPFTPTRLSHTSIHHHSGLHSTILTCYRLSSHGRKMSK